MTARKSNIASLLRLRPIAGIARLAVISSSSNPRRPSASCIFVPVRYGDFSGRESDARLRLLFTSNALLRANCNFSLPVVTRMTDFDSQLYPVKLSLPLSLREQEFYHLLHNWPVEPDASRGACPVRRRLCEVILKRKMFLCFERLTKSE